MIKKAGHILLTAWLAILLLFGTTPKDFIHLFATHTDTVHTHVEKDGLVIETEHHHCCFLDDALPLFIDNIQSIKFHTPRLVYPVFNSYLAVAYIHNSPLTSYLRGPPAIVS